MDREIHIRTLTVTRTEILSRPDGRAALAIWTNETKPFALELTVQSLDVLREQLVKAEAVMNMKPGHA